MFHILSNCIHNRYFKSAAVFPDFIQNMCQIKQETRVLRHMIINFNYVNFKLYTTSTLTNPKVLLILQTFQA